MSGYSLGRPYPCPVEGRSKSKNPSCPPTGPRAYLFPSMFNQYSAGDHRSKTQVRRRPLSIAPCPSPPPTPLNPLRLLAIFLAPSEVGQPAAATSRVDLFSSGARRSFFIGVRRRRRLLHRGHRADRSVGSRPRAEQLHETNLKICSWRCSLRATSEETKASRQA